MQIGNVYFFVQDKTKIIWGIELNILRLTAYTFLI